MGSNSITAFSERFRDDSFVLRSDGNRHNDAILWLGFDTSNASVNLSAYDPFQKSYSHEFDSRTSVNVADFIREVENDYGVEIPERFANLVNEFLVIAPEGFGLDVDLEGTDCEYCGFDYATVEAYYFPPVTEGGPASLKVRDTSGCYDWAGVSGDPAEPEVLNEALRILDHAASSEDNVSTADEVRAFAFRLRQTFSV